MNATTIANGAGIVAVVKSGSFNQTINNTQTYTGGTRIDAGTLTLGHATDTLADTGAVNVNGGTLAIGTKNDTVGAVTLTSGSITGSTGVITGSGYTLKSGTVNAILGGSGIALTKDTSGTVTISGNNTYTGTTTVSGGTLLVNNTTGSGTGTGSVSVAAGGYERDRRALGWHRNDFGGHHICCRSESFGHRCRRYPFARRPIGEWGCWQAILYCRQRQCDLQSRDQSSSGTSPPHH